MEKLRRIVEWTKLKIRIQKFEDENLYFHEREVWWVSLGSNIGNEQDGKNDKFERPVLVFRKFGPETFWGLPMSSKEKDNRFNHIIEYNGEKSTVLLTQLRLLSRKRLIRKLRRISKNDFKAIRDKIKSYL
ncbi:MAG: type II toxin-antitoxin system PemK/MazF family toxin [bacterium]|nr:type II toxin-antitoxin system PemK/MazF family toxin [bacterium]